MRVVQVLMIKVIVTASFVMFVAISFAILLALIIFLLFPSDVSSWQLVTSRH